MMPPAGLFLDELKKAADAADAGEGALRREFAERLKQLEQDRKFAYRRLNFMRVIANAIAQAESEEIAVAHGLAAARTQLGWNSDSDPRAAVLTELAPLAQAIYASLSPDEDAPPANVLQALRTFEDWYAANYTTPFWALFDVYIPETPLVDF